MVVGLEAVFPDGSVRRIKNVPRRATGPDIRHLVIGNEGALCYVTEVTVKVFKYRPENNEFHGFLVDDMATGTALVREVVTDGFRPSVVRVHSPEDARQHFSHFYEGKCVVIFVAEGPKGIVRATREEIEKYHKPLNAITVEEALKVGGSMVHHHGIGKYRTTWTEQEHGSAYPLLAALKKTFDPNGIMNKGTVFPVADES